MKWKYYVLWYYLRDAGNKYLNTPVSMDANAAPINYCLSIQTRQYNK